MSTLKLNPMWDEHRALQPDNFSEEDIQEMTDFDTNYAKLKELYPNFDKLSDAVQQKLLSDTLLEQHEMAELLGCTVEDMREADAFWNELAPQLRDKFFKRLEALGTPDILVGEKAYDFKKSELSKVLTLERPQITDPSLPNYGLNKFSSRGEPSDVVPVMLQPGGVWNIEATKSLLAQLNKGSLKAPTGEFYHMNMHMLPIGEVQDLEDEQKAIFDNPEDMRVHDEAIREMIRQGNGIGPIIAGYEIEEEIVPLIREKPNDTGTTPVAPG
jgi:hypothetical protein